MLKNIIAVAVIILIVVLLAGLAGNEQNEKSASYIAKSGNRVQNVVETQERQRVEIPAALYNHSGKILKLEKNAITFNAELFNIREKNTVKKELQERRALVDDKTKIKRLSFENNIVKEEEIDYKDLKVGDYVEVMATTNIAKAEEFVASKVIMKDFK